MAELLHGEYKVPGGKLVAVDLAVADGHLAQVRVSGDFFLDPDEALEVIDEALEGLSSSTAVGELTAHIEDALARARTEALLPRPVTMAGFDARAVAMAVRRALGHATSWSDHTFTYLDPGPLDPALHAALDEVLGRELAAGRRGPTLRFWEWENRAVVIGSFQSLRNEVDAEAAERYGVQVVRRISGGGAMFMEAGNCITFSLVVPESLVDGLSYEQSYAFLDEWVLTALAGVGVNASYAGLNDIASPAGKIAGAAQKRFVGGAVLHHVTMAYDIDADKMLEVLRIGREKM
ncbi:MAG TPA: biotin/lipoate A/B protein ligase family protein, partial [Propionibacteriaceae bacterium]|nr:biotin/lipoate A/B protein ligase family protein [Propionibacteriaceae bacterium]